MNPKEKAEELVDKFYLELKEHKGYYDFETAKQCALICADEILYLYFKNWGIENSYYADVKQEIKKL